MKTVGIICEYNPPHNGHAYQIAEIRKRIPDAVIVCVMSGCFVQRGAPAILAPGARARAAVGMGADVVVELPPVHALSPAELFARGGVSVLQILGVDTLCFGAETVPDSGDPAAPLRHAAENLDREAFRTALAAAQKRPENAAIGFPALREQVYRSCFGDAAAELLRTPNNILGIEYIRAIRYHGAEMHLLPIPRKGAAHDAPLTGLQTEIASATAIRDCILRQQDTRAMSFLPACSAAVFAAESAAGHTVRSYEPILGAVLLSYYRAASPAITARYAGLSGGLAERLRRAAVQSAGLAAFYQNAVAKNLTAAAVRRAALCGYFGITQEEQQAPPQYLRLLARAESAGAAAVLRRAAKESPIPLISRPASYKRCAPEAQSAYARDLQLAAVWGMLCDKAIPASEWLRRTL